MNAEYIADAKALMSTADRCDSTTEQARRLYTQAARILRACPRSTDWSEASRINNLIQEADYNASL
jgi:hypothetical protein